METREKSCGQFLDELASAAPAPGGGGAAALCGAAGIALGSMVGELTVGKKKYAETEAEIKELMTECKKLAEELLALVDEDARCFESLMAAYGLPKDTQEECVAREAAIEENLRLAASAPLKIMEACARAIDLIAVLAQKGSSAVVSDAGCGAAICRGALEAASMNVYVNTRFMKDRGYAAALNERADGLLEIYSKKAEDIASAVKDKLRA